MKFEITNFDDVSSDNDEFSDATPGEPSDGHYEGSGDDTSTAQFSEVEDEISDDDSSSGGDDEFSTNDEDSSDEWDLVMIITKVVEEVIAEEGPEKILQEKTYITTR
jgi:hypothetical protein